jgi:hypothetical protein
MPIDRFAPSKRREMLRKPAVYDLPKIEAGFTGRTFFVRGGTASPLFCQMCEEQLTQRAEMYLVGDEKRYRHPEQSMCMANIRARRKAAQGG